MIQTWGSGTRGDKKCEDCGAVYIVTVDRFPSRDYGYFDCQICGERLDEWNSTHSPNYTLAPTQGRDVIR